MENFTTLFLSIVILFLLNDGEALKCRSNQQVDAQFVKVLKTCRKRYSNLNMDNEDSSSSDSSDSESTSSSEEDDNYNKHFLYKQNDRSSYNQSVDNQRYRTFEKNSDMNDYSSDRANNGNSRDSQNAKSDRKTNDRDSWNSRDSHARKDDFNNGGRNNGDMHYVNNTNHDQACIIQCFFNEMHAVDQKGFPERDMVISLMSQNIQDQELKDFVEKSIMECFRYLDSNRREKCEFSQNLLTCFAQKGKQSCEDWVN